MKLKVFVNIGLGSADALSESRPTPRGNGKVYISCDQGRGCSDSERLDYKLEISTEQLDYELEISMR